MLEYLNHVLGLSASLSDWEGAKRLPAYLRSGRKYYILSLLETSCLLVACDAVSFSVSAFEARSQKLAQYFAGNIVLSFDALSPYQRKALIERNIPFIVPNSQVFLPFLGTVMSERMPTATPTAGKLSAASQLILLILIYTHGTMNKTTLAERAGVSKMTVTRSIKELLSARLVVSEKTGSSDHVRAAAEGKEIYELAKPFLISPVRKRVFVRRCEGLELFPLAGISALSKETMLNPAGTVCRAIWSRRFSELAEPEVVDPNWVTDSCTELEVWRYSPEILAQDGCVDVISLALSLKNDHDERVEQALYDLLEGYRW